MIRDSRIMTRKIQTKELRHDARCYNLSNTPGSSEEAVAGLMGRVAREPSGGCSIISLGVLWKLQRMFPELSRRKNSLRDSCGLCL
jgi:hypothetical protein